MPRNMLPSLAVLAGVMRAARACEERPSSDAGVDQETDQTNTIDQTAPSNQVETNEDPTPQTGTGGDIPETDEGSSQ